MQLNVTTTASPPIITKSDIARIKEYISTVKALPITIGEVQKLLESEATGIANLEPYDIVSTFTKIINNANSWNDIELSMKKVASGLNAFHADLSSFGKDIIDAIVTMPGYKNYLGTLDGLTEEEIASLPPLKVGQDEKNRFPTIKDSIHFIASSIEQKRMSSTDIQLRLGAFKNELSNEISVMIGEKLKLAGGHELNAQITKLNADIDAAQQLVDEKTREHEPNFFDYFMAVASPVGSLYMRTKALLQDVHVAPLIRQRDELTEQVRKKHVLTGTLQTLHNRLYSVDTYIIGAVSSTALLETLWITISEYIDSSKNKIDGIHEFLSLRTFVTSLRVVLEDWKKVDANAKALTTAFD
ncbi:alpha-xenorhabdolysin family binary toxin subunit A [Pseudomonas sp. RT4P38]